MGWLTTYAYRESQPQHPTGTSARAGPAGTGAADPALGIRAAASDQVATGREVAAGARRGRRRPARGARGLVRHDAAQPRCRARARGDPAGQPHGHHRGCPCGHQRCGRARWSPRGGVAALPVGAEAHHTAPSSARRRTPPPPNTAARGPSIGPSRTDPGATSARPPCTTPTAARGFVRPVRHLLTP